MFSAISHLLLSCVQGSKMSWFTFNSHPNLDPLHHQNSINVQACFQGSKNQKNCSQGFLKPRKNYPKSIKNNFCEKLFFVIPSKRKSRFKIPSVQFGLGNWFKKWPGNKPETKFEMSNLSAQKTFKEGPRICKNQWWKSCSRTPWCPSCGAHTPTRCRRGTKMVPRVPKWRHQAPQMATARS